MKVLAIFGGAYPNGGAMANRLRLYCKGLTEEGYEVKIIIPHGTDKYGNIINQKTAGNIDAVPYLYLSKSTERSNNFFVRRLNDCIGYCRLIYFLMQKKNKSEIIFIIDIRNLWRILIFVVAYIKGSKTVFELNEHPLVFTSQFWYWIDKRFVYPFFDGFIAISEPIATLINTFKGKKARTLIVPIITEENKSRFLGCPKINIGSRYILHSGKLLENKDGIIGMLKAIAIVIYEFDLDLKLYFSGSINDSSDADKIKEVIQVHRLESFVNFLGYLPSDELSHYQRHASFFIINKTNNLQNNYCFPTKLGEYLSTGKPVIITKVGQLKNYFTDNKNAFLVDPDNPRQMAEKIKVILTEPTLSEEVGIKGKQIASSFFNYKIQSKNIIKFFEELRNS